MKHQVLFSVMKMLPDTWRQGQICAVLMLSQVDISVIAG